MGKKEDTVLIPDEELAFIGQLVNSLEDSIERLEEYYKKNEPEKFNSLKKTMATISKKISERVK